MKHGLAHFVGMEDSTKHKRVKYNMLFVCAAAGGKRKGGKGRGHAPKPQMFEDTSVQPQTPPQYGYGPPQAGYGYGMQGILLTLSLKSKPV